MSGRPVRRNSALRETWFAAAFEILATQGYAGVSLKPLCRHMGVTTGAFYHSFDGWQEFTHALLDTWLRERTEATVAIARRTADPVERLRLLARAASELPHRTEAAIRVWAAVEPSVEAVQRRVDDGRYAVVHEAMTSLVGPEGAERFTVWGLSTLIGFEHIADRHASADLLWGIEQVLDAAQRAGAEQGSPTAPS